MPPNRHAVLSASSSHRWLHCNPSARLELEFEDRETEAAAEGTAAHALAEHKLRKALKMRSSRPVSKYDSDEMEMYTDGYLEFVLEAILDRSEVYSGCYARVSVNFYAFNSNGNRGIACGLGNIQKVRDGEPLGGKSSAADDFATDLDDDFLS